MMMTFPTSQKLSRFAIAATSVLCLSLSAGCISLLPDPGDPQPVLALEAATDVRPVANPLPVAVGVTMPNLDQFLAGNRVVVRDDDGSLAYLSGVRLASTTALSLQNLMIQSLDQSGAFRSAIRADTNGRPELELHWDVSRFEVTLPSTSGSNGVATMTGTVRLVRSADGAVIGSRTITTTASAARGEPAQAVIGLQAAARDFARQAIDWLVQTGRSAVPAR